MGVGRLVVIGLLVWLCFRWWQRRRVRPGTTPRAQEGGRMVSCETCGIFVPQAEASRTPANTWRCSQHRDDGPG